jgi:hypothetical protein
MTESYPKWLRTGDLEDKIKCFKTLFKFKINSDKKLPTSNVKYSRDSKISTTITKHIQNLQKSNFEYPKSVKNDSKISNN